MTRTIKEKKRSQRKTRNSSQTKKLRTSFFVYILECADKTLYIGITNDLEKRLHAHNNLKTGAHYTKTRRPVVLKYSEKVTNRSRALKRESELKQLTREQKVKLIFHRNG